MRGFCIKIGKDSEPKLNIHVESNGRKTIPKSKKNAAIRIMGAAAGMVKGVAELAEAAVVGLAVVVLTASAGLLVTAGEEYFGG